jgi:hypothetical protein
MDGDPRARTQASRRESTLKGIFTAFPTEISDTNVECCSRVVAALSTGFEPLSNRNEDRSRRPKCTSVAGRC